MLGIDGPPGILEANAELLDVYLRKCWQRWRFRAYLA